MTESVCGPRIISRRFEPALAPEAWTRVQFADEAFYRHYLREPIPRQAPRLSLQRRSYLFREGTTTMQAKQSHFLHTILAVITSTTLLIGATRGNATAQAERAEKTRPTIAEARRIAEEGFIYGLPIVMNYAVMNEFAVNRDSGQFKAPFNEINSMHSVATYKETAVITPNSDTPYSFLWLDLRAEPYVLSVPAVPKSRYYAVQLIDGNTYNYGYIGSRATGNEAGDYLVVGPGWKGETPAGIKRVFSSTTPFSLALFRTQLFNPEDMPNVEKVQSGYKAQPLSAFLKQPAPPAAPEIEFVPATTAGIRANFFEYLSAALEFVPPSPDSAQIRAKLGSIGVGPGKSFEFKDLSLEHKAAVLLGMKQGDEKVDRWLVKGNKNINGWNVGASFGDRAFFNGDWLMRAGAAKGGLYGNDAVEATYPYTRVDGTGAPLDGSKHNYTSDLSRRAAPAGECLLVGDYVRRQEPASDQEPDRSLPHQLADAARHEEERRRLAYALHPERQSRCRQGKQLAARAE